MTPQQIREFILAGNALFTLKSLRTDAHYTFKVERRMRIDVATGKQVAVSPPSWIVKVLFRPANDDARNYRYIGAINSNKYFARATNDPQPSAIGFQWCWEHLDRCGERFEFNHSGRCGRCGRLLTTPESVAAGIGPECQDKMAFEAMDGVEGLLDQLFGG